ncbi:hypothetical protein J3F83DRAFT_716468 [Trichoderma novae-zelandiae]
MNTYHPRKTSSDRMMKHFNSTEFSQDMLSHRSGLAPPSWALFLEQRIFQRLQMTRSNLWLEMARMKGLRDSIGPGFWWHPEVKGLCCFYKADSEAA